MLRYAWHTAHNASIIQIKIEGIVRFLQQTPDVECKRNGLEWESDSFFGREFYANAHGPNIFCFYLGHRAVIVPLSTPILNSLFERRPRHHHCTYKHEQPKNQITVLHSQQWLFGMQNSIRARKNPFFVHSVFVYFMLYLYFPLCQWLWRYINLNIESELVFFFQNA